MTPSTRISADLKEPLPGNPFFIPQAKESYSQNSKVSEKVKTQ